MKFTLALATALGAVASASANDLPSQTFYIPMPENDLFHKTFEEINSVAAGPIKSMIAFSIATTGTVVWYDHWEDGYDNPAGDEHKYATEPDGIAASTKIFGDGNCDNGYAPGTTCTNDSDDVLVSGQSIILEGSVPATSSSSSVYDPADGVYIYDGRDKVVTTFPIAVVRGNYPSNPGSLMAGAIEVLDTDHWGDHFVAPVGQDMKYSLTNGFEHVAFYVMAKQDGTDLTFSDGTTASLNEGESFTHVIENRGESMTSSHPVQVDLITGDKSSTYELRWFSLLPREQWTNSYFSAVGDTEGSVKILIYNPNSSELKAKIERKNGEFKDIDVSGYGYKYTEVIKKGTGAEITGDKDFIALSLTDTGGGGTSGKYWDWGFPLMPTDQLTDEVLIGWGYGCTDQDCRGTSTRSVVWVSPVQQADIYVDVDNSGSPDSSMTVYNAKRLSSNVIKHGSDISGAVIWAVEPGEPHDSLKTVELAAAWGQNAELAKQAGWQAQDLDLGTLVPPFVAIRVSETVELIGDNNGDGLIGPGDIVKYTIEVKNAGVKDYPSCGYKIAEAGMSANLPFQTFKNGCKFTDHNGNTQSCTNSDLKTTSGLCSPSPLPRRGKIHTYTFKAQIVSDPTSVDISNNGVLTQGSFGSDLPFSVPEKIHFKPSILIEKTVHNGQLATCKDGKQLAEGVTGSDVTYCYKVTNTGDSYLDDVTVTDPDINMPPDTSISRMAPGESQWVKYYSKIPASEITTDGKAVGTPVLKNGDDIETWDGGNVEDEDDAGVKPVAEIIVPSSDPDINLEKTVHLGHLDSCFPGQELEHGFQATKVTYCYEVTNTGDVALNVVVSDTPTGATGRLALAAGESAFVLQHSFIDGDLNSSGTAVGTPTDGNDAVEDTDPAGVKELADRTCI